MIDDLVDGGAHVFDGGRDWRFYVHGNFLTKGETGQTLIGSTRPFFEECLRRRVADVPNIEIKTKQRFKNWISGNGNKRIKGVVVSNAGGDVELNANLVIDARGRASTLSKELQELGYEAPKEELVGVDLGYTSRLYRAADFSPDWTLLIVNPSAPEAWIGGLIEHVENDQCLLTKFLVGNF